MLTASLRDFLLFGRLGELSCQLNESDVIRLLGPPEGTDYTPICHSFYGCLNFQYSKTKLIAVLSVTVDYPEFPYAGPLKIDPWRIRRRMPPEELEDALMDESIEFFGLPGSAEVVRISINDCATAHFTREPSGDTYLWALTVDHPDFCAIMKEE